MRKKTDNSRLDAISHEINFRDLAENSLSGFYLIQQDGIMRYVNSRCAEIFGYKVEEVIDTLRVEDVIFPEDWPIVRESLHKRISGELPSHHYDFRIVTKNKDIKYVEVYSSFTVYKGKSAIIGTLVDITKRKQAEEALKESEERYRTAIEYSNDGVAIVEGDIHLYVNQKFVEMFGYNDPNELIGKTNALTVHPDDFKFVQDLNRRRQRGDPVPKRYEFKGIKKDGTSIYIEISATNTIYQGKSVSLVYLRDITERKQAEERLKISKNRLSEAEIISRSGNWEFDLESKRVFASDGAQKIYGLPNGEWTIPEVQKIPLPEYRQMLDRALRGLIEEKRPYDVEFKIRRFDTGETIDIHSVAEYDRRRNVVFGIIQDITERNNLERQLLQAQKMEAIGTLAGGIAHDFNNILMGIQGYASLMMQELDTNHPHYQRLKLIEEQVMSAADLTRQLLGFARGGKYEMRPVNINEIIRKSSSMFGRTKKELTIHGKYEQTLWAVEADQSQIEQVFLNLYVNAWHAMPTGGELYLETRNVALDEGYTSLHAAPSGNYIKISVTDTGIGMEETTRKRIFDPFFTTKEMGRGTGLGLAMVYGIMKGHNGFINVYSEPGHGTTFTLYLPASQKDILEEKPAALEVLRGSETILLVDDEPSVLAVSKELLESLGYTVYGMGSGLEAIAFYKEKKDDIDLVILDMIMPGLSGGETFDRIRELNPSARTILSSGYSLNSQAQQIMNKGCHGFIQKPFSMAHISWKVREVLGK